MAGYSKRSLLEKLGIKDGMRVCILNDYKAFREDLGILPEHVVVKSSLSGICDYIHFFTHEKRALTREFGKLKTHLSPSGMLWISWPKQSSMVPTDLNENTIRDIGLTYGLVDVKVCAMNDIWSGLKFVYRLIDR